MSRAASRRETKPRSIPKASSGIAGLDEITGGGLPRGRTTLVCGGAGAGKTLLALEFLARGAIQFGEPGVLMSFEETAEELAQNVRSLGFDLEKLARERKLVVDYVHLERSEIAETGEYDLSGLFIRMAHAIDTVGAKRVVLDTIEALFAGLDNPAVLRAELRRLFRWLKDRGVTAIVTGERGEGKLTRHGLEEYVSDCVIVLDHRVTAQLSTRRLRVVKYRGTTHGTNEYPFLIDADGISVLPVTSLGLKHGASDERVSSGIAKLDTMLGGGAYRGSSVLITGTPGTGKTSICAGFADAACRRGERCLFFAFEESESQLVRNMASIGFDLAQWLKKELLRIDAARPTAYGLELHLARMHRIIDKFQPDLVVVDPVTTFLSAGTPLDAELMVLRLIDFLKGAQITGVLTSLTHADSVDRTQMRVSSIIDSWVSLRDIESAGERYRAMYVVKSRGMSHSNRIREFVFSSAGIVLNDGHVRRNSVAKSAGRRT